MTADPEAPSARRGASSPFEAQCSPQFTSSFPYMQASSASGSPAACAASPTLESPAAHDHDSILSTSAEGSASSRCAGFLRLNVVQRIMSAAVLAPAVTIFLWLSPAFATTTVCSFMASTCSYEYACLSNRIRLRILTRLEALEGPADRGLRVTSEASIHNTRINNSSDCSVSSGDRPFERPSRPTPRPSTATSTARIRTTVTTTRVSQPNARELQGVQEEQEIARVDGELRDQEARLRRSTVTGLATCCFRGHEWLAAGIVSILVCSVSSVVLLMAIEWVPTLEKTEFYASRWFYTIVTGYVAALCACLAPDWQYTVVTFLQYVLFSILTMHSTACPINQLACTLDLHPSHVFLSGMVLSLVFRFASSRSGPEAFVTFALDVLGLVYITGSLSVLVAFVDDDRRTLYRKLLISLLYIVWASDTGAYITGKILVFAQYPKYNPLAAHLSKNKDYEGTLGAVAFGIAAMAISSDILELPGSFGTKVAFTVLAVVVGRLGDLFESLLKRAAGVKDSGKLIPGHGGVLDRIDALMFATLIFSRYYALMN